MMQFAVEWERHNASKLHCTCTLIHRTFAYDDYFFIWFMLKAMMTRSPAGPCSFDRLASTP